MRRPLPRAFRKQLEAEDAQKVERIVAATEEPEPTRTAGATAGGDGRRMRGLPIQARGVRSAIPGTVPGERLM